MSQRKYTYSCTQVIVRLETNTALQINLSTLLLKTCIEISTDLLVYIQKLDSMTTTLLLSERDTLPHCTYVENHLGIDVYIYPESEHKSRRVSIHSMSNHVVTLSGDLNSTAHKTTFPFHFKSVTLDTNDYRSIRNISIYTNR